MLVMTLFNEADSNETPLSGEFEYPDEVLDSEWNPVLDELHSKIISERKKEDAVPQQEVK
jgi:hypothetical protein